MDDPAAQAEVIGALGRLGLLGAGETPRFVRLTGGVSSDIWRVDLARGPVCVKRALPQAEGRGRLAGAGRAQRATRRPGCAAAARGRAGGGARAARPGRAGGRPGDGVPRPGRSPAVEGRAARRPTPIPASPRAVGERLARIHAATAGDPEIARGVPDRPHLPRHPARALSGRRPRAGASRPAPRRSTPWSRRTATHQAGAGAWRRQPEEHPGRAATGRCSSMPNAPGTAIRPSISPSASTTCC